MRRAHRAASTQNSTDVRSLRSLQTAVHTHNVCITGEVHGCVCGGRGRWRVVGWWWGGCGVDLHVAHSLGSPQECSLCRAPFVLWWGWGCSVMWRGAASHKQTLQCLRPMTGVPQVTRPVSGTQRCPRRLLSSAAAAADPGG